MISYLQAKEDLALHLEAFIQEGLQVAPPVSLLAQPACLLAQLGLSLHQLIPNLPVARVGMRCLITLQPALHTRPIRRRIVSGNVWIQEFWSASVS